MVSRPCCENDGVAAGVLQDETAGAVRVLRHAGAEARLAEQRRLLVAGDAGDRDRAPEDRRGRSRRRRRCCRRCAGSIARGMSQFGEHALVPVAVVEVVEHRARRVRRVDDVRRAARELVDRATNRPCRRQARPLRRARCMPSPLLSSSQRTFVPEK